jgi:hypothetical protein
LCTPPNNDAAVLTDCGTHHIFRIHGCELRIIRKLK